VTPVPPFHKILTPGPDGVLKEKRRILPESTPAPRSIATSGSKVNAVEWLVSAE